MSEETTKNSAETPAVEPVAAPAPATTPAPVPEAAAAIEGAPLVWDEFNPNLYQVDAGLFTGDDMAADRKSATFGFEVSYVSLSGAKREIETCKPSPVILAISPAARFRWMYCGTL